MRRCLLIAGSVALAGCAHTFQAPVTGQASNGQMLQGSVTASTTGEGHFWIASVAGLRCSGNYNSLDPSPTISADVHCEDGRTGTLLATRQLNGFSGTGSAQLSDGTQARFVFGDLTFAQYYSMPMAKN